MGHPEFHQSAGGAFLKLFEVCPVDVSAQITVVTAGNGAFRFNDRLYIGGKAIGIGAHVLGKIMGYACVKENQENDNEGEKTNQRSLHGKRKQI